MVAIHRRINFIIKVYIHIIYLRDKSACILWSGGAGSGGVLGGGYTLKPVFQKKFLSAKFQELFNSTKSKLVLLISNEAVYYNLFVIVKCLLLLYELLRK